MFKLLTIGILCYVLFRMIVPNRKSLTSSNKPEDLSQNIIEDIDYEEVDESS